MFYRRMSLNLMILRLVVYPTSCISNKSKFATSPLFNGAEVLPYVSDKTKLFAENFSENSNLDDS